MTQKPWSIQALPVMGQQQFEQWQALLEKRTGMRVGEQRKPFLQTGIGMRMRELGLDDYQHYYDQICAHPAGAAEWVTLVDRLTVQETQFFRHESSMRLAQAHIYNCLEQKGKALEIWSVGCSTGEEPFSLAMLAQECVDAQESPSFYGITASDISIAALSKARSGCYAQRKAASIGEARLKKFFTLNEQGEFKVNESLKQRVCFARVNVQELDRAPMHGMDLIYCQNLLIYFVRWRRKDILNCMVDRLRPGGIMILGLGEVVDWSHEQMQRIDCADTLAFRKLESKKGQVE